jgi:ABC-type phosphate transport system substrate-binding protein
MRRRPAFLLVLVFSGLTAFPGLVGGQKTGTGAEPAEPGLKELAVVVNPANPVNDISSDDLKSMFLRKKKNWSAEKSVIVVNYKAKSWPRVLFDKKVLAMSPDKAAAYWIDRRIRGEGPPPRSLSSARLIQRIAARNPEVIAYVPVEEVTSKVKVLKVNGWLPGSANYPLRQEPKR